MFPISVYNLYSLIKGLKAQSLSLHASKGTLLCSSISLHIYRDKINADCGSDYIHFEFLLSREAPGLCKALSLLSDSNVKFINLIYYLSPMQEKL